MNILCKQVTDHCSGIDIILRKPNIQFKLKRLLYIDTVQYTQCKKLSKVIQVQCTNFNFFPKNWEFLLVFKVNENLVRFTQPSIQIASEKMEVPLLYNTWNPERFECLKNNEGEGDFVSRMIIKLY